MRIACVGWRGRIAAGRPGTSPEDARRHTGVLQRSRTSGTQRHIILASRFLPKRFFAGGYRAATNCDIRQCFSGPNPNPDPTDRLPVRTNQKSAAFPKPSRGRREHF